MTVFLARKLLQALAVCLGVSVITFSFLHLSGDPALLLLPVGASDEEVRGMRQALGLDAPVVVQFARFLAGAALGDFGHSLYLARPAIALVLERIPPTLELALAGLGLSLAMAVPLGIVTAIKRDSPLDRVGVAASVAAQAMPTFWLGIMLMILFAMKLQWVPVSGRHGLSSLVLPAVTLSLFLLPVNLRLTRSGMLDSLAQDYIRTARAKGLPEWRVITFHALRNSLNPVVAILGLQTGRLLGGAVMTETVFAWPGLGSLVVESIRHFDFPVVQAAVFYLALMIVAANVLADLLLAWLDPRVREVPA